MKRRFTAYPVIRLLFLVWIVALLPVSVWAQKTSLTAEVPAVHTLHLELTGNGKVIVDGVPYKTSEDIQIKRNSTPVISVAPNNGWMLKSLSLNGEDITGTLKNGTISLPEINSDMQMTVVLQELSGTPQTGYQFPIGIYAILMLLSVAGIIVCVTKRRLDTK